LTDREAVSLVRATADARGCVLAGGAGSRLGEPKAAAVLAGRALISYPLEALAAAGLRPAVLAKPATVLPELDAEVWLEPDEPRHPLQGIVEALQRSDHEAVVVCACDMPFVTADLVGWLARLPEPLAVAATADGAEPLLGRYARALVERLADALAAGRSMRATVASLDARLVGEDELGRFGDPKLLVASINTRGDLDRAERLLAGRACR
jgi:molybdopterin-guanine dinucleotide biosynthesis protein A